MTVDRLGTKIAVMKRTQLAKEMLDISHKATRVAEKLLHSEPDSEDDLNALLGTRAFDETFV